MRLESALLILDELDEINILLRESLSPLGLGLAFLVLAAAAVAVYTSSVALAFVALAGGVMLASVAASLREVLSERMGETARIRTRSSRSDT